MFDVEIFEECVDVIPYRLRGVAVEFLVGVVVVDVDL